jgi:arylsulfatase A-like enzyme
VGLVPDAENFNGPQPRSSFTPYFPDADPSLSTAGGNPNSPWGGNVVPSEWRRIVRSAYAAGVAQTDAAVGKLLSRLDELGLASSTMVIIAGDNGFFLGETGQWNKDALFDQADRVPLIVRVPWLNDSRPVGTIKRSRRFFDLVDLYPTSAALLSVANKLQPDLDGVDKSGGFRVGGRRGTDRPRSPQPIFSRRCKESGLPCLGAAPMRSRCLHLTGKWFWTRA